MNTSDLVASARQALANLESEPELLGNALFPAGHAMSYGSLRFIVRSALESMALSGDGRAAQKRRRQHAILVRCDLRGEVHKSVIDAMALSRRQFYRERHEALLFLAELIRAGVRNAMTVNRDSYTSVIDLGDAAEAYLEALRAAGQYRQVFEEASALAVRLGNVPRAMECGVVAAEAARFLGRGDAARRALHDAYEVASAQSYWSSLWLASGTMSLHWLAGNSEAARSTIERAVRKGPSEANIQGRDAVLLAIVLCTAARVEVDCGNWDRARSFIARASALEQKGNGSKRQSRSRLAAMILRLCAQVAEHADGDRFRALRTYQSALMTAKASGDLGTIAETAIRYAAALAGEDSNSALQYADYGLDIARRFYSGDRLCELTLEVVPLLVAARGIDAANAAIDAARNGAIGTRDALFVEVAQAHVLSRSGKLDQAIDLAESASARLFSCGIDAWACEAQLCVADASVQLGFQKRARRGLVHLNEALKHARHATRVRAARMHAAPGGDLLPA